MGLEDRYYYRSEYDSPGGFSGGGGRTMVTTLIIINVAVALIDWVGPQASPTQGLLAYYLSLPTELWQEPWRIYSLLTYGFAHASLDAPSGSPIFHILINMFVLWMFGREVESRLGKAEFLRFYLASIVVAGLVYLVYGNLRTDQPGNMVGASGAVMAVFGFFVFLDPKRTLLIWGIIPAPAWLLFGLYVLADIVGFGQRHGVAHEAHLAGVGFAALYFYRRWNLGRMLPGGGTRFRLPRLRRPNLKVHRPEAGGDADANYRKLEEEGDRILQKIAAEGEESLTAAERKTLERYSRRMRQKHR